MRGLTAGARVSTTVAVHVEIYAGFDGWGAGEHDSEMLC